MKINTALLVIAFFFLATCLCRLCHGDEVEINPDPGTKGFVLYKNRESGPFEVRIRDPASSFVILIEGEVDIRQHGRLFWLTGKETGRFTLIIRGEEEERKALAGVYPNPARNGKVIFEISENARIQIFSIAGERIVDILATEPKWIWDCTGVASGVYIYIITDANHKKIGKIGIIR